MARLGFSGHPDKNARYVGNTTYKKKLCKKVKKKLILTVIITFLYISIIINSRPHIYVDNMLFTKSKYK